MSQAKKRLAVLTGGGDCPGLNAVIRAVVKTALNNGYEIFGIENGFNGLVTGRMGLMDYKDVSGILPRGGTILGTTNRDNPFKFAVEENGELVYYDKRADVLANLEKHGIEALVVIGGDGSLNIAARLAKECGIKVVGVPKTIDNDLVNTDHTPGFGSAAKYVASTVREIAVDASVYDNKKSVTIVEIMGRHAGWLTAASALARKFEGDNPVLIYLPEVAFDTERFIQDVSASLEKVSNVIVCISEGINDGKGTFICELASEVGVDTFGHKMLTGSGKYLENLIKDRLGVKVRSVELNVSQRCSSAMLSATDLQEAVDSGAYGVKCALHGESGKMIAFVRADGEEYKLSYEAKDVNEICNREKGVPAGWITKDGSDVSDEFIRYAKPLIQGEVQVPQQDGLPLFAYRK